MNRFDETVLGTTELPQSLITAYADSNQESDEVFVKWLIDNRSDIIDINRPNDERDINAQSMASLFSESLEKSFSWFPSDASMPFMIVTPAVVSILQFAAPVVYYPAPEGTFKSTTSSAICVGEVQFAELPCIQVYNFLFEGDMLEEYTQNFIQGYFDINGELVVATVDFDLTF